MKYDTKGSIENIWNGVVYDSDENSSIIKNAGYNYEVKPGDSVSYGYTVAGTVDFPESISLCTRSVEYGADEYTVTLNVDNDWDTGFIGTINVTATGDKPVEAWTLGFDADFELTSVQNGCIVSSDNNSYTVESSYINAFIQPGETRSFGISGRKDAGAVPSVNDFSLNGYIVDGEYSSEGTHNGDDEKPSDDKPDNGSDEKPDDHDDPVVNDTDIVIYAMGTFNAQQNAVDIEWYSTEDGEYDIMESDDNSEYTKVTSVSGFNTYSYKITESFVKKYIKIRVKAGNRTAESIPFVVKVSSDGYTVEMLDTDNDGLTDLLEEMLGTDKTKPDTDEDGLTDHQEMYITGTDPSKYDSVTEGVADGNADPDNDGLGNLREIELGTNPNDDDTDHDGLNDGDEVNVYGTDPLNSDTDHDGLPDGDEPHIGLDPTNPKTFGTPDAEYVTEQTIPADSEVLEEINTPENPYELSIEYTGTGYAEGNLTAGESSYSAAISSDMQLGTIAELSFGDSCNLNKAVLKYSIKNGYLNNEVGTYAADNEELKCIKRLGVFTFDEETNILIPVVTEYDTVSNTLTAEVDTQGTYLLIDMEKWLDEWDIADTSSALVRLPNIAAASSAVQTNSSSRERGRPHDVAFLLQCSTVNEYSLEKEKKLIENLCSQLFYDYSDINIYIVKYYNDYNQTNFVKIHDDSYALHSISEVKAALALCKYDRCLSYVRRSIAMDRIMNTIGNRHMHYDYIFDLMNGYTYAPYRSDTRLLFEKYNTMYSEISLGHYDYDDDQQFYEQFFADYGSLAIYDIGNSDIKLLDAQNKMYEFMTGHPFQSVSYISSLNLRKLDLKHPLEVNGTTDSDSDGLTDWEEVFNEGNLITHDGTHITALPTYEKYVNYALRNTDRAESIRTFIRKKIGVGRFNIVKNIKVLPLKSDPRKRDTDQDTFDDGSDPLPMHHGLEIYELNRSQYVNIHYTGNTGLWSSDNNISYGGNQTWFLNDIISEHFGFISELYPALIDNAGCGLIAAADTIMYLYPNHYNVYDFITDDYNYDRYMDFVKALSNRLPVFPIIGELGIEIDPMINNYFRSVLNSDYRISNKIYLSNDECVDEIKRMLNEDIPVIFSYNTFSENNKLPLYIFDESNNIYHCDNNSQFVKSHYMVITGLLESTGIGFTMRKTGSIHDSNYLLQVSSWGRKYYIELDDILRNRNRDSFTNILSIYR